MFSLTQRAQDVSGFMTSTMCVMGVIIAIVSLLQLQLGSFQSIPGELAIKDIHNSMRFSRSYGGRSGHGKENVKLKFDLDADLTPLFNWNTKQVFVYLVGEYEGMDSSKENSKVVFWDHIIPDAKHAKLQLKNKRSKYSVYDFYPTLTNRTATMKLEFNVQPWVGPLVWGALDTADEVTFGSPKGRKK